MFFQSFIFELRSHPLQHEYLQCTTIGSFPSKLMVNYLSVINNESLIYKYPSGISLLCFCVHYDLAAAPASDDW